MKILVIADEESQKIWDFFRKEDYADIDLVISCGDLKADYLSFIATMIAVRYCMCMETMMISTKESHRRDVSVLKIPCICFMG